MHFNIAVRFADGVRVEYRRVPAQDASSALFEVVARARSTGRTGQSTAVDHAVVRDEHEQIVLEFPWAQS